MATRIEPLPDGSDQGPPCGGSWQRDADGGLTPLDAATALAAGLHWSVPPVPPVPLALQADTPKPNKAKEA